jgi:hypothetical protein
MPRTKVGGIFGTGPAKTQHGFGPANRAIPQLATSRGRDLFDRDREAADQCGDFIQPCRIVGLDRARQTGEAFVVAEFGDVRRQNGGSQRGTVDQDVSQGNQLRKGPAPGSSISIESFWRHRGGCRLATGHI